jgi:predicted nucleic-acid-binding protein
MIAVDTNVIVRFFVPDDPTQTRLAAELLSRETSVWIPTTVLLETEWVLRGGYGFKTQQINQALSRLLVLPQIVVEDLEGILLALELHAEGMDFADAIHLTLSSHAKRFATFDKKLLRRGNKLSLHLPEIVSP